MGITVLVCTAAESSASTRRLYYSTAGYPEQFSAIITGMPDLDQVRREIPIVGKMGLPTDGINFCAPSAVADLFGFLAMNGFAEVLPLNDPETWDDRTISGENDATQMISYLGGLMATAPDGGTDFGSVVTTIRRELNRGRVRGDRFKVDEVEDWGCFPSSGDSDTSAERIWKEIANGNLVYGNLDYYISDSARPGYFKVGWAHAIVITGAVRVGGKDFLTVVEPGSGMDESPYYQGTYRTHTYEVERNPFDLSDGACRRTATEVMKEDTLGLSSRPMLSGLIVIKPPRPYEGSEPLGMP
jgi:hypothetical protein